MSYPHYPRPQMNVNAYQTSNSGPSSIGATSAPLTIIPSGTTVLAYYQDYAWYFGVVQSYNLTRTGTLVYQVLFRSGEIRPVSSSQALSQQSNNQNIEVGSRVVVQHPTKAMYISSLVAELPGVENMYRYLLFLDDGSACYKTKDKLWVINLVENPILMLPLSYKSFIQRFFTMTGSTVELLNLNPNDSVNFTNYDNTNLQFSGKVIEVDCSIVLVRYSIPNSGGLAEEWIHRGSSRIISIGQGHSSQSSFYPGDTQSKTNGSTKQGIPPHSYSSSSSFDSDHQSSLQQRFMKSPLKGKPYMVPPSLDPFMFSGDENSIMSASRVGKHSTLNTWPVSDNGNGRSSTCSVAEVARPPILSPKQQHQHTPQDDSPILILDESPMKDPPPYSSPKPSINHLPNSVDSKDSPQAAYNDSFLSPSSLCISPSQQNNKPISVFSWSGPENSITRRRLELSPDICSDLEFDFSDTILDDHIPVSTPATRLIDPLSVQAPFVITVDKNLPLLKQSLKKEEVVVIDDDEDEDGLPPLVIENVKKEPQVNSLELDEKQLQAKDSFKREATSRNVPMILHQEACLDTFSETPGAEISTIENGNVIEVVVHTSNHGEAYISVTPSIEIVTNPAVNDEELVRKPSTVVPKNSGNSSLIIKADSSDCCQVELKSEACLSPPLESKSRKRRLVKSPNIAIPKLKINLKAINEVSKDVAAQKCVKRARKQQSKDHAKDEKQALAKKKKIAKASELNMKSLLITKKEQIKLNSEAKIARWSAPWLCRQLGNSYRLKDEIPKASVGDILVKMGVVPKLDEELEEGELDDSDGEESSKFQSTTVPQLKMHTCSFLCNTFTSPTNLSDSPYKRPILSGWERIDQQGKISYISPCGIVCLDMSDIQKQLLITKCTHLYTTNFCFSQCIAIDTMTPPPDFEPLYSVTDLSCGLENVPVSFISNIGPIIKYNFHYVVDTISELPGSVLWDRELTSCSCESECSPTCPCRTQTPTSECNSGCSCAIGCVNRVVQRGLAHQLQIVQLDTEFRVTTLHDIPENTFICSLSGVVRYSDLKEHRNFVYHLRYTDYDAQNDSKIVDHLIEEVNSGRGEKHVTSSLLHHNDSNMIISNELESANRGADSVLSAYSRYSPLWVRVASRHNKLVSLADASSSYPSLTLRRDSAIRKNSTSDPSNQNDSEPSRVLSLDCTEYGSVGRFVPVGESSNCKVIPVVVDSVSAPWLSVWSTCHIFKGNYLVLKSFQR